MTIKAEADSECPRRADTDQMEDAVRRRFPGFLKRLLRVIRDVALAAADINSDEMSPSIRLQLTLVSLLVDHFTGVGDLLRRSECFHIDRHFVENVITQVQRRVLALRSPRETVTL